MVTSGNQNHYCVVVSTAAQRSNDKAALLNSTRWNTGDQIRVAFMEGDPDLQNRVKAVAQQWTAPDMANLTFQFVEQGDAEIRIGFLEGDGSWSYLGTECRDIPADETTMNYGWLTPDSDDDELQRVVLHEFGHALGLIHEHQNPRAASTGTCRPCSPTWAVRRTTGTRRRPGTTCSTTTSATR